MSWPKTISLRTASKWDLVVLAACSFAFLLALQTLHGGQRSFDEGVYWQSLRAMANGHALFDPVFSSQPPLFLLSVYPFYLLFGQDIAAARSAMLFFSIAGLIGTYVAGRALGSRVIGAVACLLLALDPLYERAAQTLGAEMPSIALQIWAVACAALSIHASEVQRRWLALGAGVLLGCAALMKLFAIAALVPVVLFLCAPFFRWLSDNRRSKRTVRDLRVLRQIVPSLGLLALGLLGVLVVTFLPFIGRLDQVYDQMIGYHLAKKAVDAWPLGARFGIIAGHLSANPLVYVAVLATVVVALRRMWVSVPLVLWALGALVVLLNLRPVFYHHIALLSPALALVSGCGAAAALHHFQSSRIRRVGLAATLGVLVAAGSAGLFLNLRLYEKTSKPPAAIALEMAKALQASTAPGDLVLSDHQYVATLADRDVPPQLVDTSYTRIVAGYLTKAQLEDLMAQSHIPAVLFATGRLEQVDGFRAFVEQRYSPVSVFGDGKVLFVLDRGSHLDARPQERSRREDALN